MSFPALSGRFAISTAACAAAPEEMPPRIPSSFARRRAIANDSSFETWNVSSTNVVSRFFGMNPAPMPWILWGPGAPPEITGEFAGSTAMILSEGFFGFQNRPTPVIVPPVPTPATKMSILPSVSFHSSGAVVAS